MNLQLLHSESEFPCIWGKLYFLFYQCTFPPSHLSFALPYSLFLTRPPPFLPLFCCAKSTPPHANPKVELRPVWFCLAECRPQEMGRGAGLRVGLERSIRVARVRRGKIGQGEGVGVYSHAPVSWYIPLLLLYSLYPLRPVSWHFPFLNISSLDPDTRFYSCFLYLSVSLYTDLLQRPVSRYTALLDPDHASTQAFCILKYLYLPVSGYTFHLQRPVSWYTALLQLPVSWYRLLSCPRQLISRRLEMGIRSCSWRLPFNTLARALWALDLPPPPPPGFMIIWISQSRLRRRNYSTENIFCLIFKII